MWYDAARQWIADDRLVLIGLTQEQHKGRCRLFAQWKQLDIPILWDPFNLTDSKVVPNFIAIDEHGIVRSVRPDLETFEADFLDVDFPAPEEPVGIQSFLEGACACSGSHHFVSPISSLVNGAYYDESVAELVRLANEYPDRPRFAFRAGVALRLRYDSEHGRPSDFQGALDMWTKALALDPNQYIWRRRIQQYGPRMDKPYPFYSWVSQAQREVEARGETPVPLLAELTGAELAEPRRDTTKDAVAPVEPDPEGKIRRDELGLITIETAVAFDTSKDSEAASVHLALRPTVVREAHWNHESGPAVQVWIGGDAPVLLNAAPRSDVAVSAEVLRFTADVTLAKGAATATLPAYALYYVCEGESGTCVYLRQDFEVVVERP